jgi:uncharacterized protein
MGQVTAYPNGTFCWIDLGTPDVERATSFYRDLFGWETEALPMAEGGAYVICRLHGMDVTAIHEHAEQEGAEWGSYISVDDVDRTTAKGKELGATVVMEPFDLMDVARLSVISDPTGGVVSLWQPRPFIGAGMVNEVGTWTWNELATTDFDAAKAFYTELFDWEAMEAPGPMPRAGFSMGDLLVAGIHQATEPEGLASRWTVTFRVQDADQAVASVEKGGGRVLLPPMDIPVGRFAIVSDPSGAGFTITAVPGGPLRGVDGS